MQRPAWHRPERPRVRALTFQPSNHSFIQPFELQLPAVAWGHEMPTDHTRTAILNAAERLYADRGFADVTLRDIVAAADVNLAAVNYHFGSKDELIAELFVTRSLATNRERLNELKAGGRSRRRPRRHRRHPARAGRTDAARLPRPRPRALDRGALHDPRLDRIGAADPPHQEPRNRSFAEIRRRDAALAARPQRGRSLLGPAFRAGDGAPDHPRQRAADKAVGRDRAISTTSTASSSASSRCR